MGLILDLKFCRTNDIEQDTVYGGYTILEALTYCMTCGKSAEFELPSQDNFTPTFSENVHPEKVFEGQEEFGEEGHSDGHVEADPEND